MEKYYEIKIGNITRKLELVLNDKISYYSFNMLGDAELNAVSAQELSNLIDKNIDAIVTVESKSIALVQEIARLLGHKKYVVVRKTRKSYMKNEVSCSGDTIISGKSNYYIDGCDVEFLKGKNIVVIDDVISTGGTITSLMNLLKRCNLEIKQFACVFLEGNQIDSFKGIPLVSCGFFPLPEDK